MHALALVVLTDVVFLAQPVDDCTFIARHLPCPRGDVRVEPPPESFGHTVLMLWLGDADYLVKVSSEREANFWMTRLNAQARLSSTRIMEEGSSQQWP
jgi:hypothetical protein